MRNIPQGENGDRSSDLENLSEDRSRQSGAIVRLMYTNALGLLDVRHAKL